MLELLPNEHRKAVKKEYFLRLSAVTLFFFMMAGVLSLVSLSPFYFLSVVKKKIIDQEFSESVKKFGVTLENEEMMSVIKSSKEMISLLAPPKSEFLIKNAILGITGKKNPGISINGISINLSDKSQNQILVNGKATNRESLKSFVENIKAEKRFAGVDLPISNFAKITDIDFNIIIKIAI